ncbi:MAG: glycosyltransferase [Thiocapsa sp.]|nr:MAG: glycosyltransferase [Thiocapsa sp.]
MTPSYNQAGFLEETLRSVLLQGYPALEYFVIDGGSTDSSIEIIRRYAPWLTGWVSEPDHGQTHAINKGFARATGEIFCFLNSDDTLEPGALFAVARAFQAAPGAAIVIGACEVFDEVKGTQRLRQGRWHGTARGFLPVLSLGFAQQSSFWRAELYRALGGFDETFHYSFDREYFLRAALHGAQAVTIDQVLSRFRLHGLSKTGHQGRGFVEDSRRIIVAHGVACGLVKREQWRAVMDVDLLLMRSLFWELFSSSGLLRASLTWASHGLRKPALLLERRFVTLPVEGVNSRLISLFRRLRASTARL